MKLCIEKELPRVVSLGVVVGAEEGFNKVISLSLFKWVLIVEFGKGEEYDRVG